MTPDEIATARKVCEAATPGLVDQTVFGKGGNCFAACVATMLGLPLDAVPPSAGDAGGNPMAAFLRERGLLYLEVPSGPLSRYATDLPAVPAADLGWCPLSPGMTRAILMGPSPRGGFQHCIVGETNGYSHVFLHDPHYERTMLPYVTRIGYFVALAPHEVAEARTGWPRALDALDAANAEVERLKAEIESLRARVERLVEAGDTMNHELVTHTSHGCCKKMDDAFANWHVAKSEKEAGA